MLLCTCIYLYMYMYIYEHGTLMDVCTYCIHADQYNMHIYVYCDQFNIYKHTSLVLFYMIIHTHHTHKVLISTNVYTPISIHVHMHTCTFQYIYIYTCYWVCTCICTCDTDVSVYVHEILMSVYDHIHVHVILIGVSMYQVSGWEIREWVMVRIGAHHSSLLM